MYFKLLLYSRVSPEQWEPRESLEAREKEECRDPGACLDQQEMLAEEDQGVSGDKLDPQVQLANQELLGEEECLVQTALRVRKEQVEIEECQVHLDQRAILETSEGLDHLDCKVRFSSSSICLRLSPFAVLLSSSIRQCERSWGNKIGWLSSTGRSCS